MTFPSVPSSVKITKLPKLMCEWCNEAKATHILHSEINALGVSIEVGKGCAKCTENMAERMRVDGGYKR